MLHVRNPAVGHLRNSANDRCKPTLGYVIVILGYDSVNCSSWIAVMDL